MGEVLRGAAKERRAADVDHLHRLLGADAEAARDLAERIEVDADEVERADLVGLERCGVLGVVAAREDGRVDTGMERLDPASEQLGDAGDLLDALDVEADLGLEEVRRSAARDELEVELGQAARELLQAGLVVDGDQRSHSSLTTSGRIRCSTAWILARSVSRGSTATGSWRITGPVSTPSST